MPHSFIFWLGGFAVGFWLGGVYVRYRALKFLKQLQEKHPMIDSLLEDVASQEAETQTQAPDPLFFTETVNGSIMLYDKSNSKFMCQGKTLEELAQNLNSFKRVARGLVQHADKNFFFIDGKVKQHIQ